MYQHTWLSFFFLFVYFCFRVSLLVTLLPDALRGQMKASAHLEVELFLHPLGSWESNPSLLQEQPGCVTIHLPTLYPQRVGET